MQCMQSDNQGKDQSVALIKQINQLEAEKREEDKAFARLKKEKMKLVNCLPNEDASLIDEIPHYRNILSLVEETYWLELKEKSIKRELKNIALSAEARSLGQHFLSFSLSSSECVFKRWFEELETLKAQQPELLRLSIESKNSSSVHNIDYKSNYCAQIFTEDLSFTVLCETVNVRLKLKSHLPCSNKHNIFPSNVNLGVCCDIDIPDLENCILLSLKNNSPVSNIVSHIANYVINDISPYVIGLPLKKLKKKKAEPKQQADSSLWKADCQS